jgi:GntR family transcriptional regulator, rspAB operon transcriptional repressor
MQSTPVVTTTGLNGHTSRAPLKRDQAYVIIRRAIIHLDLQPGSLIDETALSQQLDLGRTPIREALQRLMHEGLVAVFPRRGMMVAPVSLMDFQHLSQARMVWEPNIARMAAQTGAQGDWDALEAALAETPTVFTTMEETERGADVDRRFHTGIAQATRNPLLVELMERHQYRNARLAFLFFRHGLYDPVTEQHYGILEALREGNGDRAAALMEEHVEVTRQRQARVFH